MNDKELKEYISRRTEENIKNTEAIFDYLQRNVELSNQIIKEKEDILKHILARRKNIVQLKLFDYDDFDKVKLNTLSHTILRGGAGVIKAKRYDDT